MSMLNYVVIGIVVTLPLVTFTICFVYLIREINRLTNFIMAQKDIVTFNRISSKPVVKSDEDKKKEKETKEFDDYMKIINKGICDKEDIERFGITNVDQG